MTDSACKDGWRNYFSNLTNQFCTDVVRSRDSCKGDSGGPVMIHEDGRWIQYGVVSAGSSECGSNALPSLNVDVAGYLPWIKSIIFDNIRLDAGNTSSIYSWTWEQSSIFSKIPKETSDFMPYKNEPV